MYHLISKYISNVQIFQKMQKKETELQAPFKKKKKKENNENKIDTPNGHIKVVTIAISTPPYIFIFFFKYSSCIF